MSGARRRLHVLVEGSTEEAIVRQVIAPHLESFGWDVTTSIVITKRPNAGPAHRGGVSSWAELRRRIRKLLGDSSLDVLTTVIDYYGFPSDAPGMSNRPAGSAMERVGYVEKACAADIDDDRFVANLALHEVEAWVFAAPDQLANLFGKPALAEKLRADARRAGGVEMINDGPSTAPSKRILCYVPTYSKTADGPLAISELGLGPLRDQCPHLHQWLCRLEGR